MSGLTRAVEAGDLERVRVQCDELRVVVAALQADNERLRAESHRYRTAIAGISGVVSSVLSG